MAPGAMLGDGPWGGSPYIGLPIVLAVGVVLGLLVLTGRKARKRLSPPAIAAGALAAAAFAGSVLYVTVHVHVHGMSAAEASPGNRGVTLRHLQQRQTAFAAGVTLFVAALLVWRRKRG